VLHELLVIAGLRSDDRLTDEERRRLVLGRSGAFVFLLAAVLVFAAGRIGGRETWTVEWLPAIALVFALVVLRCFRYLSLGVSQWINATGTLMIGAVVSQTRPTYGVIYVLIACCLAFFFPLRWVVAQTLLILVTYGVALWYGHDPEGHPFEPWLLLAGTLVVTISLIVTLQQHAAQLAIRERRGQAILDAFFASSPLGLVLLDRDLRFVRVNETYAAWTERTPAEHVGLRLEEVNPSSDAVPSLRSVLETGEPVLGRETTRRGRILRNSHYPIRDVDGKPFLTATIIDDVTDMKRTEERLEELLASEQSARLELEQARSRLTEHNRRLAVEAATDPLTRLPNRTAFETRLAEALDGARRTGRCVGVVYLDLDDFKEVNDRFGHAAGDELLQVIARRLSAQQRPVDLCARLGGDEFLILLADLEPLEARATLAAVARRVEETISAPVVLPHGTVTVACSGGTSLFPDDADTADALVAAADVAMYRRKLAS
jgi:diguanylate cyclase (GGDEF)-like protein/PAS domain S-box-containing protein